MRPALTLVTAAKLTAGIMQKSVRVLMSYYDYSLNFFMILQVLLLIFLALVSSSVLPATIERGSSSKRVILSLD